MQSESTQSDSIQSDANRNLPKRFSLGGCMPKSFSFVAIGGLVLYGLQMYMRPEVDIEKTKPVLISSSVGDSGNSKFGTKPAWVESGLPEGAVTARVNQKMIDQAEHPFDPLLEIAQLSLAEIDKNFQDYTATLVSQVRVDGKLQPEKYVFCKIRHARTDTDKKIPFSAYTLFLKPKANVGQEAIWVDGWHDGNLVAHTTGMLNVKKFYLDPDGPLAMEGNRHPIRAIGFRNLIVKMAELAKKDRKHGECSVTIERNVEVNGAVCTVFEVVHPVKRDHFENHIARIYIDDSENIPIAYEAYLWPEKKGDEPPLLEKYYYTELKKNVGLTHEDFQADNKAYNYPAW